MMNQENQGLFYCNQVKIDKEKMQIFAAELVAVIGAADDKSNFCMESNIFFEEDLLVIFGTVHMNKKIVTEEVIKILEKKYGSTIKKPNEGINLLLDMEVIADNYQNAA